MINQDKTLTVFTPTYNRKSLLSAAYESLCRQTSRDFVWLVVDDGSTDGTDEMIRKYQADSKIAIKYIRQENSGKHMAMNTAFVNADTPLIFISLDSDDTLLDDCVETVIAAYEKYPDSAGYVFNQLDSDGHIMSRSDFDDGAAMRWRDAWCGGHFDGECVFAIKTDVIRKYSFPKVEGEKFLTEGFLYLQFDEEWRWFRSAVYKSEYRDDGYSKNIASVFAENPVSYSMYNRMRLKYYKFGLKKLKYAAYYDGFSIFSHQRRFIGKSNARILSALMYPAGMMFALYLGHHRKK